MHGITILLKNIERIESLLVAGQTVIEIGSTRDVGSTYYLAQICQKYNLHLITVDPSLTSYEDALKVFEKFDYPHLQAVNQKGEEFLAEYNGNDICLAYLDGFDIVTDHPHKQSTVDAYAEQGIDLLKDGNRISAEVHLQATKDLVRNACGDIILCFDDTWQGPDNVWMGKGATAVPFLLNIGAQLMTPASKKPEQAAQYDHGVVLRFTKL